MARSPRPACGTQPGYSAHLYRRETPCQDCRDAHAAWARDRRPKRPRAMQPCGTAAAAQRHRKRGEPLCDPCTEALRIDSRTRFAANYVPHPRALAPCGTSAARTRHRKRGESCPTCHAPQPETHGTEWGYVLHRRRDEQPCGPCAEAHEADLASRRTGRPKGRQPTAEHGTSARARRHLYEGEPMCEPCRLAERERERLRREAKRAARAPR